MKIPPNSFIPFVTAGHPDLETSREIILALAEAGSAVIEIGIPFSDPIADGPIIQRSSFEALEHGYRISDYLQMVREVREKSDAGLVFMTYLNPVLQFGLERLDREGPAAGLDGILISDLTPEEYLHGAAGESRSEGPGSNSRDSGIGSEREARPGEAQGVQHAGRTAREAERLIHLFRNLETVFLVAPTSSDERIEGVCEATTGYVYLIARTGVTGKQTRIDESLGGTVRRIRSRSDLPIAVGFGIRSREDVRRVWEFAEGAIVGSAIVRFIAEHREAADLPRLVSDYVKSEFLP